MPIIHMWCYNTADNPPLVAERTHARLKKYYRRMFGFQEVLEVGDNGLRDLPHLLVWGGVGTRMDGDLQYMLRKCSATVQKSQPSVTKAPLDSQRENLPRLWLICRMLSLTIISIYSASLYSDRKKCQDFCVVTQGLKLSMHSQLSSLFDSILREWKTTLSSSASQLSVPGLLCHVSTSSSETSRTSWGGPIVPPLVLCKRMLSDAHLAKVSCVFKTFMEFPGIASMRDWQQ